MKPNFDRSYKLVKAAMGIIAVFMGLSLYLMGDKAAGVITIGIGAIAGLPAAYSHVTNKRETDAERKHGGKVP